MLSCMDAHILELGATEFHLVHARMDGQGRLVPTTISREIVANETTTEVVEKVGQGAWRAALRAFERMTSAARARSRSGQVVAIAPDPFHGAADAVTFAAAAARRTGVCPVLLSRRDTLQLLYAGARAEAEEVRGYSAVIGLGDGALDFASGSGPVCSVTDRALLGVARLHRAFGADGEGFSAADAPALFSLVRLSAGPASRWILDQGTPEVIMTSELALSVLLSARMFGHAEPGSRTMDRASLHALVSSLLGVSPAVLVEAGIEPRHAVLLSTAAVVIDSLADLLRQRQIHFGAWGVREGAAIAALSRRAAEQRRAG